jgi:CRISPR-associated protein Cmr3
VASFLAGDPVEARHLSPAEGKEALLDYDERTGIGIDPERLSAEESRIYSIGFLSLDHRKGACFYAEALLPQQASPEIFDAIAWVAFGGEGRKAKLKRIEPITWPERNPSKPNHKPLLLMTTPAVFSDKWRPAALAGRIAGASVPGYLPISGWDLARRGPKQTRFAASAGSVFFLGDSIHNLPDTLAENDEDRLSGYGCYLKGVWSDD